MTILTLPNTTLCRPAFNTVAIAAQHTTGWQLTQHRPGRVCNQTRPFALITHIHTSGVHFGGQRSQPPTYLEGSNEHNFGANGERRAGRAARPVLLGLANAGGYERASQPGDSERGGRRTGRRAEGGGVLLVITIR